MTEKPEFSRPPGAEDLIELAERALGAIPAPLAEHVRGIGILVEDAADDETLEERGIEPPYTLYGLYRGVDITQRDSTYGNVLPDAVFVLDVPVELAVQRRQQRQAAVDDRLGVGAGSRTSAAPGRGDCAGIGRPHRPGRALRGCVRRRAPAGPPAGPGRPPPRGSWRRCAR